MPANTGLAQTSSELNHHAARCLSCGIAGFPTVLFAVETAPCSLLHRNRSFLSQVITVPADSKSVTYSCCLPHPTGAYSDSSANCACPSLQCDLHKCMTSLELQVEDSQIPPLTTWHPTGVCKRQRWRTQSAQPHGRRAGTYSPARDDRGTARAVPRLAQEPLQHARGDEASKERGGRGCGR